jgi:3-dehydroquinate dehydratase-2
MNKFLILHGVNLNMFGKRDPHHYGTATLDDINLALGQLAHDLGVAVECFQTNHEGVMIEKIHAAQADASLSGVVINAGAWTHYSYAIRDALAILNCPIIEVHMSDVHAREPFRHHSCFDGVVQKQISGLGVNSYLEGLKEALKLSQTNPARPS